MRVKITNHNPPGGSFHTPSGFVDTDKDGIGNASAEQFEHLKKRPDLKIVEVKEKPAAQDGIGNASAEQFEHLKKRPDLKIVEVKEKPAAPAEETK